MPDKDYGLGCGYKIKQVINTLHTIPSYDEERVNGHSIAIAYAAGRYGVVAEDGERLAPFVYDNITVIGFGLLLLIRGGKMGLLHLTRDDEGRFAVKNTIECGYDYIETRYSEGIFLLRRDTEAEGRMCAYLDKPGLLTPEYQHASIIDRDFVDLCDGDRRALLDARTGRVISDDGSFFCCGSYEAEGGRVLQDESFDMGRLIFVRDDGEIIRSPDFVLDCLPPRPEGSGEREAWARRTDSSVESLARCILPLIQAYFDGEEERQAFAWWLQNGR